MKPFLGIIVLFLASLAHGQKPGTATLHGTVLDAAMENEPMLMAQISVKGTPHSAHTGFNGNFSFDGLPQGSHQIQIAFPGYQTQEKTVVFQGGETVSLVAVLHSLTPPPARETFTGTAVRAASQGTGGQSAQEVTALLPKK
ncbi:carboxypeptidase-like regulatory domain-containing protein [Maribacter sp. 2307ULW6-5]|uniref:carboxypeptidase-like regulatory domain-containing protein n=1 Tax=Maribacter sp. 2307ULW6-5 TaxID=3386275 RepID=UPI0039BC6907